MTHRAPEAALPPDAVAAPWPDSTRCARCRHSSAVQPLGGYCRFPGCPCEAFKPPAWYRFLGALGRFRGACRPVVP